eukprot:TRINITY_DN460_c0_g1_i1.p1 TRINITY_DN460_c0_g1~~TRINITY_DN460_c0_g1_i1.p1  ORF type:complete len:349 (+),score=36.00 TRINITY_DN460_c0_g1_i1:58-1104(+)
MTTLITGANAGIGYETALQLARDGRHIVLACRNMKKAEQAVANIKTATKNEQVECMELDLSSLQSVFTFARRFNARELSLRVLVLNAGILPLSETPTTDGFEGCFGVNHLGHFALSLLLKESLVRGAPARLISVASFMHASGVIDFPFLLKHAKAPKKHIPKTGRQFRYNQSKLCNVMFAYEFQRRFGHEGIYANALCPGVVASNILSESNWFIANVGTWFMRLVGKSCAVGALTSVYCVTSPELELSGGKFYSDCAERKSSALSRDPLIGRELWNVSCRLSGLDEFADEGECGAVDKEVQRRLQFYDRLQRSAQRKELFGYVILVGCALLLAWMVWTRWSITGETVL